MRALVAFELVLVLILFFLWYRERLMRQTEKERILQREREVADMEEELKALERERVDLRIREKGLEEKLVALKEAQERFQTLSAEALQKNNEAFLKMAQGALDKKEEKITHLIDPVKETLGKLDKGMRELEKERKGDQATLKQQLEQMIATEKELRQETSTLVKSLRMPLVRGQWGEIQLKRVVELAGMVNHCDFVEQSVGDGALRPDMIVKLPGSKQIIIDSKVPFEAYFEAMRTDDPAEKEKQLARHARHVRQHILALGKKSYWEKFDHSPEFVVLFLPAETFFSAALEKDPALLEIGIDNGVILATPTTLIGLLRAVAFGWKQDGLSAHAKEIGDLGAELYKRIGDLGGHFAKLGRSLSSSIDAYNKAVGSLESRVLVSARKFQALGFRSDQPPPIELIEQIARPLQSPELSESELSEQE